MKRFAATLLFAAALAWISSVRAGTTEEVSVALDHYVKALNARDLTAVREMMWDSPDRLWFVPHEGADGPRPVWGRDSAIKVLSDYQLAEIWHVQPTVLVDYTDVFTSGSKSEGSHDLELHINLLWVKTSTGWRVAADWTIL
jgi:ketosteroid isomerase-like protein